MTPTDAYWLVYLLIEPVLMTVFFVLLLAAPVALHYIKYRYINEGVRFVRKTGQRQVNWPILWGDKHGEWTNDNRHFMIDHKR
jgi:hypothetical protein